MAAASRAMASRRGGRLSPIESERPVVAEIIAALYSDSHAAAVRDPVSRRVERRRRVARLDRGGLPASGKAGPIATARPAGDAAVLPRTDHVRAPHSLTDGIPQAVIKYCVHVSGHPARLVDVRRCLS